MLAKDVCQMIIAGVGTRCVPGDCCWRWHNMCARRLLLALAEGVCQAIAMQNTDIILVDFKADVILVICSAARTNVVLRIVMSVITESRLS
jgi:hypothetical protein